MTCRCGESFIEVYHRDFPTLCQGCALTEIHELNEAFKSYYRSLTVEQRTNYFNKGPYSVEQLKDIIYKF